jgi:hypothetical protein
VRVRAVECVRVLTGQRVRALQIRSNMHGTLVRKFLDLMQEYQAMLTKYDKKFRDKAYKEVQIGTHPRHTHTHTQACVVIV